MLCIYDFMQDSKISILKKFLNYHFLPLHPESQHKDLICLSIPERMQQLALAFLSGPHLNCLVLAYAIIVYS